MKRFLYLPMIFAINKTVRLLGLLVLGFLLMPVLRAHSQITLDLSDIQERFGEQRTVQTFEADNTTGLQALVNTSGANQTWDFTTLSFTETLTGTVEIVPLPADVPGSDNPAFDNATHVTVISFENETNAPDSTAWSYQSYANDGVYSYGLFFESSQDVDGDGNTPDEVVLSYSPRFQSTALPLTFGTAWTSATTQTFEVMGQTFSTNLSLDAEVDGYGTLITPAGNAQCLRVRRDLSVTTFGFTTTATSFDFITKEGLNAFISLDQTGQPLAASYQVDGDVDTSVEQVDAVLPDAFCLDANYPNPFNPQTTIRYTLPSTQPVTLTVYDVLGREVEYLVNRQQAAGTYEATFDATGLPSGTYIYRLETPAFQQTRPMLLLK